MQRTEASGIVDGLVDVEVFVSFSVVQAEAHHLTGLTGHADHHASVLHHGTGTTTLFAYKGSDGIHFRIFEVGNGCYDGHVVGKGSGVVLPYTFLLQLGSASASLQISLLCLRNDRLETEVNVAFFFFRFSVVEVTFTLLQVETFTAYPCASVEFGKSILADDLVAYSCKISAIGI